MFSSADIPKYSALADLLKNGEIIPFIGTDIHRLAEPPLISVAELAQRLALQADCTFPGSISKISQYYQMTEFGRGSLVRTLRKTLETAFAAQPSNPLYDLLSRVPQPLFIISAAYDTRLEHQFAAQRKPFVILSHSPDGIGMQKILMKINAAAPELISADELSKRRFLENGQSILYKICGCFGVLNDAVRSPVAEKTANALTNEEQQLVNDKLRKIRKAKFLTTDPAEEFRYEQIIQDMMKEFGGNAAAEDDSEEHGTTDALLISEEDYFTFARHVEKIVPPYLKTLFRQRSLLVLGHDLNEWHDRLVVNTILDATLLQRKCNKFAVQESPGAYELAYWGKYGVKLYQMPVTTFVEQLIENYKDFV